MDLTSVMEKQIEKDMENEMVTVIRTSRFAQGEGAIQGFGFEK